MSASYRFPYLRKEQIAEDTFSFFFGREGMDFDYLPGQYVRMTLSHPAPDERGTSRFFTIASSPTGEREIMITTRVIESTFKKTLIALKPGQEVEMYGPLGKFVLDTGDQTPKVFLAEHLGLEPNVLITLSRSVSHLQAIWDKWDSIKESVLNKADTFWYISCMFHCFYFYRWIIKEFLIV